MNALSSGGSVLDVAAVVALVGWTIVELIVIWSLGDLPARARSRLDPTG